MSERKIIKSKISIESFSDILANKTPDEVIAVMEQYKQRYAGRDIFFVIESYDCAGGISLRVYERRLETDRELDFRLSIEARNERKEAKRKQKQEKEELEEYQRLKKKFEKPENKKYSPNKNVQYPPYQIVSEGYW